MIPVLLFLSLAPATCHDSDHACQAARWIALAKEDSNAVERAQSLHLAHREFLYLFDETHTPEVLCRAREVLAEARALKPMPEYLVDALRKSRAEASERERKAGGIDCAPKKKKNTAAKGPRLASKPRLERKGAESGTQAPAPTSAGVMEVDAVEPAVGSDAQTPAAAAEVAAVDPPAPAEEPPPLMPVRRSSAPDLAARVGVRVPDLAPNPPRASLRPPDRQRRLRDGGMALLLTSAGLAGGMAATLVKRADITRQYRGLGARIDSEGRDATPAEYTRVQQLDRQYGAWTAVAAVTGAAAGIGVVAGVALLAVRHRRVLALPWSGPRSAGFTLQGRF